MIPADVASRLRFIQPDQPAPTQPVTPGQKLADVLSDLVPGQRVLAEIQGLLPNGTYRAIVAQRDVTLALPFAAKSGDTLELEVVDYDGKLALAIAGGSRGPSESERGSVATTLSPAGKLIGDLLGQTGEQGKRAAPAPLNGNLPLIDRFPDTSADLAPVLKDALSKSGVFYEAHQARWVAGELPTQALRDEPQGKASLATSAGSAVQSATSLAGEPKGAGSVAAYQTLASPNLEPGGVPRELAPIVQQQLDALATQNYAWQGQVWPEQTMWWEIAKNPDGEPNIAAPGAAAWRTRLKLTLPSLGRVEALIDLQPNGGIDLTLTTDEVDSEQRLRNALGALRKQVEAAGLSLLQARIDHGEIAD